MNLAEGDVLLLAIDRFVEDKLARLGEVFLRVGIPFTSGSLYINDTNVTRHLLFEYKVKTGIQIDVVYDGRDELDFYANQFILIPREVKFDVGGVNELGDNALAVFNELVELSLSMLNTLHRNLLFELGDEWSNQIHLVGRFLRDVVVRGEEGLEGFVDGSPEGHMNTILKYLFFEDVIPIKLVRA